MSDELADALLRQYGNASTQSVANATDAPDLSEELLKQYGNPASTQPQQSFLGKLGAAGLDKLGRYLSVMEAPLDILNSAHSVADMAIPVMQAKAGKRDPLEVYAEAAGRVRNLTEASQSGVLDFARAFAPAELQPFVSSIPVPERTPMSFKDVVNQAQSSPVAKAFQVLPDKQVVTAQGGPREIQGSGIPGMGGETHPPLSGGSLIVEEPPSTLNPRGLAAGTFDFVQDPVNWAFEALPGGLISGALRKAASKGTAKLTTEAARELGKTVGRENLRVGGRQLAKAAEAKVAREVSAAAAKEEVKKSAPNLAKGIEEMIRTIEKGGDAPVPDAIREAVKAAPKEETSKIVEGLREMRKAIDEGRTITPKAEIVPAAEKSRAKLDMLAEAGALGKKQKAGTLTSNEAKRLAEIKRRINPEAAKPTGDAAELARRRKYGPKPEPKKPAAPATPPEKPVTPREPAPEPVVATVTQKPAAPAEWVVGDTTKGGKPKSWTSGDTYISKGLGAGGKRMYYVRDIATKEELGKAPTLEMAKSWAERERPNLKRASEAVPESPSNVVELRPEAKVAPDMPSTESIADLEARINAIKGKRGAKARVEKMQAQIDELKGETSAPVTPREPAPAPVAAPVTAEPVAQKEASYVLAKGAEQDARIIGHKPESETLVMMTPDEYESAVAKQKSGYRLSEHPEHQKASTLEKMRQRMADGEPIDAAYLEVDVESGLPIDQEGAHRALVAKELGIKEIPVVIYHKRNGGLGYAKAADYPDVARKFGRVVEPAPATPPAKAAVEKPAAKAITVRGVEAHNNYDVRPIATELDDSLISHTIESIDSKKSIVVLKENPKFNQAFQNRDRETAMSGAEIYRRAKNPSYDELLDMNAAIDRGAPIREPGGKHTLSGNGRKLVLETMRREFPENFAEYQRLVKEKAKSLGIDVSDMKAPILERELAEAFPDEAATKAFADEANKRTGTEMTAAEKARVEAEAIDDDMLAQLEVHDSDNLEMVLRRKSNFPLLKEWVGKLPETVKADLLEGKGLSRTGQVRLKNALLARTFSGKSGKKLANMLTEEITEGTANLEKALAANLPKLARMEARIRTGAIAESYGLGEDLVEAVTTIKNIKDGKRGDFKSVAKLLETQNMFGSEFTPVQETIMLFIEDNARSPKAIREGISAYVDAVNKLPDANTPTMFEMTMDSKEAIWERIANGVEKIEKTADGNLLRKTSFAPIDIVNNVGGRARMYDEIPTSVLGGGDPALSPDEMAVKFSQKMGITLRKAKGRLPKGVRGQYGAHDASLIVRNRGDMSTVAHEIQHSLDHAFGLVYPWQNKRVTPFDNELAKFWKYYPDADELGLAEKRLEGVAVWMENFIRNPELTRKMSPRFSAHFDKVIPEIERRAIADYSRKVRQWWGLWQKDAFKGGGTKVRMTTPSIFRKMEDALARNRGFSTRTARHELVQQLFDSHGPSIYGWEVGLRVKGLRPEREWPLVAKGKALQSEFVSVLDDFEVLLSTARGTDTKVSRMLGMESKTGEGHGLRLTADSKPKTDPVTGQHWSYSFWHEPLFEYTLNKGEFHELRKDASVYLIARRTIEKTDQIKAQAANEAATMLKRADDIKFDKTIAPRKRIAMQEQLRKDAKSVVERANEISANYTGVGGGYFKDDEAARKILEAHNKSEPARKKAISEFARRTEMFGDFILDYTMHNGRITKETRDLIKESNLHYVTFARDFSFDNLVDIVKTGGGKKGILGAPAKIDWRIKGGQEPLDDPTAMMLRNFKNWMHETDTNKARSAFFRLFDPDPSLSAEGRQRLAQITQRVDDAVESPGDPNIIAWYDNGELRNNWVESGIGISMREMLKMDKPGVWDKIFRIPKNVFQASIIRLPAFFVRNRFARDPIERVIKSQVGSKLVKSYMPVYKKSVEGLELSGGGQFGYFGPGNQNWMKAHGKAIETLRREHAKGNMILMDPRHWGQKWMRFLESGEIHGRTVEYTKAVEFAQKELGMTKLEAMTYGAHKSRELLDFARGGILIKTMNRYIPFINPMFQGADTFMKAMRNRPILTTANALKYVGIPSIANYLYMKSLGEEKLAAYNNLPPWRRWLFWNVPVPGTKNFWVSIPKGFEFAVMGTAFEHAFAKAMGDEEAFEGGLQESISMIPGLNFAFGYEVPGGPFSMMVQAALNEDLFMNKDVVPEWEKGKNIEDREGTQYASPLGQTVQKMVGNKVDARLVDFVFKGFAGGVATELQKWSRVAAGQHVSAAEIANTFSGITMKTPGRGSKDVTWAYEYAKQHNRTGSERMVKLRKLVALSVTAEGEDEREEYALQAQQYAHELRKRVKAGGRL